MEDLNHSIKQLSEHYPKMDNVALGTKENNDLHTLWLQNIFLVQVLSIFLFCLERGWAAHGREKKRAKGIRGRRSRGVLKGKGWEAC